MKKGNPGEIYHFSTDEFLSIKDVVSKVSRIVGIDVKEFVQLTEDRIGKDQAYLMCSDKSKTTLGWSPKYNFDNGLHDCYLWIKNNLKFIKNLPKEYEHKI